MSSTSVPRIPALDGIYRYRHLIAGRPAWYCMNATGEILGFRVVGDDEAEVEVVADLIVALRGPAARTPALRLINGRGSASGPSLASLVSLAARPPFSGRAAPRRR
jgi:hypothetical protein